MSRNPFADKRLMAVGLLVGAVAGAWAGTRVRDFADSKETPDLINWEQVRSIASRMNEGSALSSETKAAMEAEYRTLVQEAVPLVANYTGDELPSELNSIYAFDRVDWVNANIESFREIFRPVETLNPLRMDEKKPGVIGLTMGNVNQRVLSAEVGFLLGYLARRVLGQYDMTLLGREPMDTGKLYFVHPNILNVEQSLRIPSREFRLWLALHEATHAFEFEAHPWLREHFNDMLHSYVSYVSEDVEYLKRGLSGLRDYWARAKSDDSRRLNWIEMVMSPEQRELFNRMQATMSVIEGYSNHVMNAVGRDLLPRYEVISQRFERRLRNRTMAEVIFARITGLDIKMEQYRQGEAFINELVAAGGHDLAKRVWEGPDMLPTIEEIRSPQLWIQRARVIH